MSELKLRSSERYPKTKRLPKIGLSAALLLTGVLLFAVGFPALTGYWVHRQIQSRIGFSISGTWVPDFLSSSYSVRSARFIWKDKVRLDSGRLRVAYDPVSAFSGRLRVRLYSNDLRIELLGHWAEIQGVRAANVRKLDARLGIGPRGIQEIDFVEILSPEFQFRIKDSEK